jgi:hypothetical protein
MPTSDTLRVRRPDIVTAGTTIIIPTAEGTARFTYIPNARSSYVLNTKTLYLLWNPYFSIAFENLALTLNLDSFSVSAPAINWGAEDVLEVLVAWKYGVDGVHFSIDKNGSNIADVVVAGTPPSIDDLLAPGDKVYLGSAQGSNACEGQILEFTIEDKYS